MNEMRYGIIGTGMMGQEHIRNIALLNGARVAALCEPNPDMRAQASALAHEAAVFTDMDAMLDTSDLDALVIVSPNHVHVPQLARIASRCALSRNSSETETP